MMQQPDNFLFLNGFFSTTENIDQKNSGCFGKYLRFNNGVKLIINVKIDSEDPLINGQTGKIVNLDVPNNSVNKTS